MLEVIHLTKRYKKYAAVNSVSFKIKKGEVFGLLGPNGAGKSTLIKMLTCFHKPTSGDAKIEGISIRDVSKVKPIIGWAPQDDAFYDNLTVYENLVYFGTLYGLSGKHIKEKSDELLKLLRIEKKKNALAKSLSGGMKRRLNIAIALIHDPKVLYLDEPTAGVDPISRMALWEVIEKIKSKGMTILFCTHNLNEADLLCDRIAILRYGEIIITATPAELKKKYGETLEEAFVKILASKDPESAELAKKFEHRPK
ncbi:MAG: ABC transporter ATP-binding protein [Nanoarchaeota archaeon]|nr:ABC transporter ATP-binding protein [Nanoarchaeota archaeon]